MDIHHRLAQAVRRQRDKKGWSQEELADRSGLHRTYISGIERSVRNPTLSVLEKIARSLEVKIGDLTD